MIEHGIAARRQVQVVTALDAERDGISERTKHQIGPRSQCHDDFACDRRAAGAGDAPSAGVLFKRSRIAHQQASTLALEKRRIGFGQPARIGNESGCRQIDRTGELSGQIGLAQRNRPAFENLARDAIVLRPLEIARRVRQRLIGAKQLDPAGPPQQLRHFSLRDQRLMLDQAVPDQGQFGHRAVQRARWRRSEEVAHQPWQEGRQIGKMIAHLRRAIGRVLQDLPEIPGKHVGEDRGTFDDTAIAKTGLFAGEETSFGNGGIIECASVFPYMFPRDFRQILQYATNRTPQVRYHFSDLPAFLPWLVRYFLASSPARSLHSAMAELPLIRRSLIEHEALIAEAEVPELLRRTGWIKLFRSDQTLANAARDFERAKHYGVAGEILDSRAIALREPSLT